MLVDTGSPSLTKKGGVPFLQKGNANYPWFQVGDINSFLFLFFDVLGTLINLIGIMVYGIPGIANLDQFGPEYSVEFRKMVYGKVCPGIAFSCFFGNLYYAWMARKLSGYENRTDVTALPYGINTPGSIVVAFNVILPAVFGTMAMNVNAEGEMQLTAEEFATKVWQRGVAANFVCGILECVAAAGFKYPGQFIDYIRKNCISKAALYCPIAGIGLCWLAMDKFIIMNYHATIGMVPFAIVFTGFFAEKGAGVYGKIPSAVLVVGAGTILKWCQADRVPGEMPADATNSLGQLSMFAGVGLAGLAELGSVITIIFPVALANAVETVENIEAADHVGDSYPVGEAMIADGVGTMIGALFGSVFPTTVYIGHMRYKENKATAGYSIANGFVYLILLLVGLAPIMHAIVDSVATGMILMAVGLTIVQQTFEVTSPRHYVAVFIGFMAIICDFIKVKTLDWNFTELSSGNAEFLASVKNVGAGGGILLSILLVQVVCDLIDNRYQRAAIYSFVLMMATEFGIVHGNNKVGHDGGEVVEDQLMLVTMSTEHENEGWRFVVGYASLVLFCLVHLGAQNMGWIKAAVMDNGEDIRKTPPWRELRIDKAKIVEEAEVLGASSQKESVSEAL